MVCSSACSLLRNSRKTDSASGHSEGSGTDQQGQGNSPHFSASSESPSIQL